MPSPKVDQYLRFIRPLILATILATVFTVVTAKRVAAAGGPICSDFTPDQRPCTASEALGYSLSAAFGADQ
jgi:hypothetical protein